jgi:hypothetical protein
MPNSGIQRLPQRAAHAAYVAGPIRIKGIKGNKFRARCRRGSRGGGSGELRLYKNNRRLFLLGLFDKAAEIPGPRLFSSGFYRLLFYAEFIQKITEAGVIHKNDPSAEGGKIFSKPVEFGVYFPRKRPAVKAVEFRAAGIKGGKSVPYMRSEDLRGLPSQPGMAVKPSLMSAALIIFSVFFNEAEGHPFRPVNDAEAGKKGGDFRTKTRFKFGTGENPRARFGKTRHLFRGRLVGMGILPRTGKNDYAGPAPGNARHKPRLR